MKKLLILFVIFYASLTFASPAIDIDTTESQKSQIDQSMQQKKSTDKKESKGDKESDTKTTGQDNTSQSQWKVEQQTNKSKGVEISVGMDALFVNYIAELEKSDVLPFSYCKLYTKPKVPEDFGFTAMKKQGNGTATIDTIRASMLEQAAKSNASVDSMSSNSNENVKVYRDCMAYYGAVIGQSILTLNNELPKIAKVNEDKKRNEKVVQDIGLEDLKILAQGSINKTLKSGVNSRFIKNLYDKVISGDQDCRFNGAVQSINCGITTMEISSKPNLEVGGVQYFGSFGSNSFFAGLSGNYRISASFSYSNAIDQLESVSKYSKFAKDVQTYKEKLLSKGYAKEAVRLTKKAYDWAASNKASVRVDKGFMDSFK